MWIVQLLLCTLYARSAAKQLQETGSFGNGIDRKHHEQRKAPNPIRDIRDLQHDALRFAHDAVQNVERSYVRCDKPCASNEVCMEIKPQEGETEEANGAPSSSNACLPAKMLPCSLGKCPSDLSTCRQVRSDNQKFLPFCVPIDVFQHQGIHESCSVSTCNGDYYCAVVYLRRLSNDRGFHFAPSRRCIPKNVKPCWKQCLETEMCRGVETKAGLVPRCIPKIGRTQNSKGTVSDHSKNGEAPPHNEIQTCEPCGSGNTCQPVLLAASVGQQCRPNLCKPCVGDVYCRRGTRCISSFDARSLHWTKRCVVAKISRCGRSQVRCSAGYACESGVCVKQETCGSDTACTGATTCRTVKRTENEPGWKQCLPSTITSCWSKGGEYCPRGFVCKKGENGEPSCIASCGGFICADGERCTFNPSSLTLTCNPVTPKAEGSGGKPAICRCIPDAEKKCFLLANGNTCQEVQCGAEGFQCVETSELGAHSNKELFWCWTGLTRRVVVPMDQVDDSGAEMCKLAPSQVTIQKCGSSGPDSDGICKPGEECARLPTGETCVDLRRVPNESENSCACKLVENVTQAVCYDMVAGETSGGLCRSRPCSSAWQCLASGAVRTHGTTRCVRIHRVGTVKPTGTPGHCIVDETPREFVVPLR